MATSVRVETIPVTSTPAGKLPPMNGAEISASHIAAPIPVQDKDTSSPDARPVVRCDRCRLVQFRASHNRCRRCMMPFVVAAPPPPEPVVEAEAHPDIAAGVRAWRQQRGLTQKQLAFAAHLPRTYISRIENGRILPGLSTLERVAGALHVGLAALLDRRGCNGHGPNGNALHPNGNGHAVMNENEAFLRQMVRYCRRMTVVQRAAVIDRVKALATAGH